MSTPHELTSGGGGGGGGFDDGGGGSVQDPDPPDPDPPDPDQPARGRRRRADPGSPTDGGGESGDGESDKSERADDAPDPVPDDPARTDGPADSPDTSPSEPETPESPSGSGPTAGTGGTGSTPEADQPARGRPTGSGPTARTGGTGSGGGPAPESPARTGGPGSSSPSGTRAEARGDPAPTGTGWQADGWGDDDPAPESGDPSGGSVEAGFSYDGPTGADYQETRQRTREELPESDERFGDYRVNVFGSGESAESIVGGWGQGYRETVDRSFESGALSDPVTGDVVGFFAGEQAGDRADEIVSATAESGVQALNPFQAAVGLKEGAEFAGYATSETLRGDAGVNVNPGNVTGGGNVVTTTEDGVVGKTGRAAGAVGRQAAESFREDPGLTAAKGAGMLLGSAAGLGAASRAGRAGTAARLAIEPGEEIAGTAGYYGTKAVSGSAKAKRYFPDRQPVFMPEEAALRGASKAAAGTKRAVRKARDGSGNGVSPSPRQQRLVDRFGPRSRGAPSELDPSDRGPGMRPGTFSQRGAETGRTAPSGYEASPGGATPGRDLGSPTEDVLDATTSVRRSDAETEGTRDARGDTETGTRDATGGGRDRPTPEQREIARRAQERQTMSRMEEEMGVDPRSYEPGDVDPYPDSSVYGRAKDEFFGESRGQMTMAGTGRPRGRRDTDSETGQPGRGEEPSTTAEDLRDNAYTQYQDNLRDIRRREQDVREGTVGGRPDTGTGRPDTGRPDTGRPDTGTRPMTGGRADSDADFRVRADTGMGQGQGVGPMVWSDVGSGQRVGPEQTPGTEPFYETVPGYLGDQRTDTTPDQDTRQDTKPDGRTRNDPDGRTDPDGRRARTRSRTRFDGRRRRPRDDDERDRRRPETAPEGDLPTPTGTSRGLGSRLDVGWGQETTLGLAGFTGLAGADVIAGTTQAELESQTGYSGELAPALEGGAREAYSATSDLLFTDGGTR